MINIRQSSKKQLSVLLISPTAPPAGGMETWTEMILKCAKHDNTVSISLVDSRLKFRKSNDTKKWVRLFAGILETLRISISLTIRLVREKIDIIHLCSVGGIAAYKDRFLIQIARLFYVPIVIHYHVGSIGQQMRESFILRWPIESCFKNAESCLVLGERIKSEIQEHSDIKKIYVLPNGIDVNRYKNLVCQNLDHPKISKKIVIGFVGKVNRSKGIMDAVEACRRASEHISRFLIFGGIPLENRAWAVSIQQELPWIQFFGEIPREEVRNWLEKIDLLLLPSHSEGFPYVILEAMSMEIPVIATDVGAASEMLISPEGEAAGVIVDVGDINAIARAIKELVENPEQIRRAGKNGRRRVCQCYSDKNIFDLLASIWFSLVSKD